MTLAAMLSRLLDQTARSFLKIAQEIRTELSIFSHLSPIRQACHQWIMVLRRNTNAVRTMSPTV